MTFSPATRRALTALRNSGAYRLGMDYLLVAHDLTLTRSDLNPKVDHLYGNWPEHQEPDMPRHYPPEVRREACERMLAGEAIKDLADELGITIEIDRAPIVDPLAMRAVAVVG